MAHECCLCGGECYCHGDIDDCIVSLTPAGCKTCGCEDDDSWRHENGPDESDQPTMSNTQKITLVDLSYEQYLALYNAALIDAPYQLIGVNEKLEIAAGEVLSILTTAKFQLIIKQDGRVSAGVDDGRIRDEWTPIEADGATVRKMLREYNVNVYSEADFIESLKTQRNYDRPSSGDYFFGTWLMGVYFYVTITRKNDDQPYTYFIHGERHTVGQEYIRTESYEEFMAALDRLDAMSLNTLMDLFDAVDRYH